MGVAEQLILAFDEETQQQATASSVDILHALPVFRVFRILRVGKIFFQLKSLRRLLVTVFESVPSIANMTALLFIFVFMFALIGQELFYDLFKGKRWNFNSIGLAHLTVFQVITGDNWTTVMYDSVKETGGFLSLIYFVILITLGYYVIQNLFISIILLRFSGAQEIAGSPKTNISACFLF